MKPTSLERRHQVAVHHVLAAVCSLVLAGCLQGPIEEPEHVVPAHRPASYPAAVARLDQLLQEAEAGSERDPGTLSLLDEWTDLIRWLPDLAGDSDLKEPAWNRVNEATRTLEQLAQAWEPLEGEARREAFKKSVNALREPWKILEEVADQESAAFQLPPGAMSPTKDTGETP